MGDQHTSPQNSMSSSDVRPSQNTAVQDTSLAESLVSAFELMTIVPLGRLLNVSQKGISGPMSTVFYPLAGVFIGIVQTVLIYLFLILFQDCGIVSTYQVVTSQGQISTYTPLSYVGFMFIGAVVCLVDVILTRFMHYDALADIMDARFGTFDKTRRLKILKDPYCGAFGITAVVVRVVMFVVMVALLIPQGVYPVLIPVYALSRCSAMNAAWAVKPFFKEGIGRAAAGKPPVIGQVIGWVSCGLGFILLIILSKTPPGALSVGLLGELGRLFASQGCFLSFIALSFILGGVPRWIARGFDGMNGDVLGASVSLCEVVTLFIALLLAYY